MTDEKTSLTALQTQRTNYTERETPGSNLLSCPTSPPIVIVDDQRNASLVRTNSIDYPSVSQQSELIVEALQKRGNQRASGLSSMTVSINNDFV
jgi:hypothetical protein